MGVGVAAHGAGGGAQGVGEAAHGQRMGSPEPPMGSMGLAEPCVESAEPPRGFGGTARGARPEELAESPMGSAGPDAYHPSVYSPFPPPREEKVPFYEKAGVVPSPRAGGRVYRG